MSGNPESGYTLHQSVPTHCSTHSPLSQSVIGTGTGGAPHSVNGSMRYLVTYSRPHASQSEASSTVHVLSKDRYVTKQVGSYGSKQSSSTQSVSYG